MKRIGLLASVIVVLALLLVGAVGTAFAQEPVPPYGPGWCHAYGGYLTPALATRAAKVIGISTDDLVAQWRSGKSLAEIAQAKGISEDKLIDELLAPYRDMLAIQVKYGYLTQQEADQALAAAREATKAAVEQKGSESDATFRPWGGMMGGWGPGWMHGFGRWGTPGTSSDGLAPGRWGGMMGWRW